MAPLFVLTARMAAVHSAALVILLPASHVCPSVVHTVYAEALTGGEGEGGGGDGGGGEGDGGGGEGEGGGGGGDG